MSPPLRDLKLTDRIRAAAGAPWRLWRRSMHTRVITTVVVLSATVIGCVGWLVMRQITDGLVKGRVAQSIAEARSETSYAQLRLSSASSATDPDSQVRQLVAGLVSRGDIKDYQVLVYGPIGDPDAPSLGVRSTPDTTLASVPEALRAQVDSSPDLAWTFTRLQSSDPELPAVVVGSSVVLPSDGGRYSIYYLFSMQQEQAAINLLQRVLLTSGLLLLFLIAGIAGVVTHQVITPVRLTRHVAELVADGQLDERIPVKGEDDLARLAISFNQMTDALQVQFSQLEDLSRVQRQFVSDVSHELRTPLTTVRMAAEVLHDARDRLDPVAARAAELLQHELDRFEHLLTDLLEISRFDAGAMVLEAEPADMVDLATKVVTSLSTVAAQCDVQIAVESTGPAVAEIDVRRVERILRNLLGNAIDHADRTAVVVHIAQDDEVVAVTVRDRGVGLKPGQAALVFNRFWRADPARARTTGGTGLGLAISLEDARLHSGWLQAWGAPGAGAQFRLTLPKQAGQKVTHSPLPLVPVGVGTIATPIRQAH
ncbi:MAG TPA: MtrAB system histidine kinase MtrB [Marmoricola sp.]|nr:HAMP domain-containing histidine kinase [Nocardioidaceae bacterium]MCO5323837.1 MtrAB system histidine kinase MtrB [Nocardioidaceae bacterium]HRV68684.1 MtrAB system histidine kinase MtrB [Marmoricola sp.]